MVNPAHELHVALQEEASFVSWLGLRGFVPLDNPPPLPTKKELAGARYFHAPEHPNAPRLLVVWRSDLNERDWHGARLRRIQIEAAEYQLFLEGHGHKAESPALGLLAGPPFLVLYPLESGFARRTRFSVARLGQPGTPLLEAFQRLRAADLASMATGAGAQADADDLIGSLLASVDQGQISWDFSPLFVGERFDEDFVAFMGYERRRLADVVLHPDNRVPLLDPVWKALRAGLGGESEKAPLPSLEHLIRERRLRNGLVAAIDTVLLRLVLYRYLDAQHALTPTEEERREMALGSYDELLERTVAVNREELIATIKRARQGYKPVVQQTGLFERPKSAAVARLKDQAAFTGGVRTRAEQYQAAARGDLHQGAVADAADLIQDFLLRHHAEEFATLLAGTSNESWSFHYADLDPRAFQEFYQQTVGTDIRFSYDPKTATARVAVEEFKRTRKEQGAYYTDEALCAWLVERTLGARFRAWVDDWRATVLDSNKRMSVEERLSRARERIEAFASWRVLDPTCGGGIFLRAAFTFLSGCRPRVAALLTELSDDVRRPLIASAPASLFADTAEPGEWEWHVLLHMLYGVDIDVKAINVASNLLTLSALSYKPNGLCFPSFVNTSLKHGNALVVPVRPAEREELLDGFHDDLLRLMDLRRELRNPNLPRSDWRDLHAEAAQLARKITEARVVLAFRDLFPEHTEPQIAARVQRVGYFCYEVEFPEAFFEVQADNRRKSKRKLLLRKNPGFDVVLGNPPWEEPAAEYKHFLPEFDPEYRSLKGQASKEREETLLADPEIKGRWQMFQRSVDDYKALLTSGWYEHQRRPIRGKIPGAHTNLYKYATELSWKVLRSGGMAGLVLDGGLWQDQAASGLRKLLLDQSRTTAVCGFVNSGIFPDIDNRTRFAVVVFERGGRTASLPAVFMRDDVDDLLVFDQIAVPLDAEAIRSDMRDNYPLPELRSAEHAAAERALDVHPRLEGPPWDVDTLAEELNAGRQRNFFTLTHSPGFLPLIQGAQFHLYGVHQGELPDSWLNPSGEEAGGFVQRRQEGRILDAIADWLLDQGRLFRGGKREAALAWVRSLTGKAELPRDWVRLDWDGFRLAWRDIARNNDKRTLITGILPPKVAVTHTAPFIRPFRLTVSADGLSWSLQYGLDQLLYLAGALSSFVCDSIIRSRLSKTHISSTTFSTIPVPAWTDAPLQRRVAELCARLTGLPATPERPWADCTPLLTAVGLRPEDALHDLAARREAEIELNACAAQLYGVGVQQFRFLMDTLFMTPEHKAHHATMRDAIAARLDAMGEDR